MCNRKKTVIIGIIAVVLILIFVVPAYVISNHFLKDEKITKINKTEASSITEQMQDNNREVIKISEQKLAEELALLKNKPLTIAIYGSDARSDETSRSDVIMLMKYDPMTKKIILVSVPRDTRVDIPRKKVDKINHAYAFGGAKLLTQTIEKLFSTKIDYYLVFKFTDFKNIIDKLDGVKVDSKKDYGYSETIVPKGISILTGEQALFYVRYRHDEEGDFGRIKRQQEVIMSLSQKLYNSSYDDIEQDLIEIYTESLETDFDLSTLLDYFKVFDPSSQIVFDNYLLKTKTKIINGIYYEIIDDDSLEIIKGRLNQ